MNRAALCDKIKTRQEVLFPGSNVTPKREVSMRIVAIMFLTMGLILSATVFAVEGVKWTSLKEGLEKAKAEKKPMIVDFYYGKGCPRCEFLQKNVYDDPVITKKINDDFVAIRIDLTQKLTPEEEKLGNRFEYKNDCLLLFLDYNENVVEDPGGKRLCFIDKVDPDWFVGYLDIVKAAVKRIK
jgi:hypothetical protein